MCTHKKSTRRGLCICLMLSITIVINLFPSYKFPPFCSWRWKMVMKLMRCCIKPEAQLFESPFLLFLWMQDFVFQDGIELSEMLVVCSFRTFRLWWMGSCFAYFILNLIANITFWKSLCSSFLIFWRWHEYDHSLVITSSLTSAYGLYLNVFVMM